MKMSDLNQKSCFLCRVIAKEKNWEPDCMTFNWLVGEPRICSKCFAAKLGIQADWKPEIKDHLLETN